MAEVCERIIWSGGGAEAGWGEVIVKELSRRGALTTWMVIIFGDPARRTGNRPYGPHCKTKHVRTL